MNGRARMYAHVRGGGRGVPICPGRPPQFVAFSHDLTPSHTFSLLSCEKDCRPKERNVRCLFCIPARPLSIAGRLPRPPSIPPVLVFHNLLFVSKPFVEPLCTQSFFSLFPASSHTRTNTFLISILSSMEPSSFWAVELHM